MRCSALEGASEQILSCHNWKWHKVDKEWKETNTWGENGLRGGLQLGRTLSATVSGFPFRKTMMLIKQANIYLNIYLKQANIQRYLVIAAQILPCAAA